VILTSLFLLLPSRSGIIILTNTKSYPKKIHKKKTNASRH